LTWLLTNHLLITSAVVIPKRFIYNHNVDLTQQTLNACLKPNLCSFKETILNKLSSPLESNTLHDPLLWRKPKTS